MARSEGAHDLCPAHGRRELLQQETRRRRGVSDAGSGHVRVDGEGGVGDLCLLQRLSQPVAGRRHERRVERAAHRQAHRPLGAGGLGELHRPIDTGHLAGDDRLAGGVVVRRDDEAAFGRRPLADPLDRLGRVAENGGHGAGPVDPGAVHQLSAAADEASGARERERARRMIGGELAERVAGGGADAGGKLIARHRPHCGTVGEQRRLRVVGERQLVGRPVETESAQRDAERLVDTLEHLPGCRKGVGEVAAHAGLLGALAGKEEDDVHGSDAAQKRTTIEPHVKPAPNATSITVEPSRTRPHSMASSRAIGMDADDVLP
jgi:hypothetical protein